MDVINGNYDVLQSNKIYHEYGGVIDNRLDVMRYGERMV